MTPQRPPGRSAWIVKLDVGNPAAHRDVLDRIEDPSQPLAIFPWNTAQSQMLAVVDAFVQAYLWTEADDRTRYLKRPDAKRPETQYGRAHAVGRNGDITGGFNPYIEAFRVSDLQLETDDETGRTRFTWTHKSAV